MEESGRAPFVTMPRAARETGIGLRQFLRAVETGELPVYLIGGWRRLKWEEITAWLDRHRRHGTVACDRPGGGAGGADRG